jgi:Cytochrome c554 and c-prime
MPEPASRLLILMILLVVGTQWNRALAQKQDNPQAPQLTTQRLRGEGWWPTKTGAAPEDYVGTARCAACHKQMARTQQETPMARAAWRASETEALRSNPKLSLSTPPFQTVITHDRTSINYVVSGRGDSISAKLLWAIGDGVKGQTFILSYLGTLFESQLSYFPSIGGLDITPEHPRTPPEFLEAALGAPQTELAAQQCFACHTTASSVRQHFDPDHATPGVTCEACHGPGAQHVKAIEAKQLKTAAEAILDPGSFGPVDLVDFCGACHRAPLDVAAAKINNPLNIRFQPYRLSKSRCWSRPDPRITCIACHDPHVPLVRGAAFYDAKCLACHGTATADAATGIARDRLHSRPSACPVSTEHCVSCHMPKFEDPQFHGSFTDHDIRIVRPGDPYPL